MISRINSLEDILDKKITDFKWPYFSSQLIQFIIIRINSEVFNSDTIWMWLT